MSGRVHIVGAGLAGLAAAERVLSNGFEPVIYEAAPHAGGRCRSYLDPALGLRIDNGNHLLLSGNLAALDYAERIGGGSALRIASDCAFPFMDVATGERWTLRPNGGRLPTWVFDPERRLPGSRAVDYLAPLRLLLAGRDERLDARMPTSGHTYERLWRPILLAALNTEPAEASARLVALLLRETFGRGGDACRPVIAAGGLGPALGDPAVALFTRHDAPIRFGCAVKRLDTADGRVVGLGYGKADDLLRSGDAMILATSAPVAQTLLPGLTAPTEHRSIVNAHFRVVPAPGLAPITGLLGSLSEWLFAFPDRLSVTISGADRLLDMPRETLAKTIWREVATVAGIDAPLPPWQIVREKRATFRATPEQDRRRPGPETAFANLFLAGDWTQTGLPATLEGAVRSGRRAADMALRHLAARPKTHKAA